MISIKHQVIKVGIGDLKTVTAPSRISTAGLGSCVAVILYHPSLKTAGLIHIMLPDSSLSRTQSYNPGKFADTGIKELIERLGFPPSRLRAKIAGGAQMFQYESFEDTMRIGPRNIDAVRIQLQLFQIPITGEDVGGCSGRTIEFDPSSCKLYIRTIKVGESII
ncbi:chemotaxis protein CheD [Jeotgalibacillus campisalis]|uniref:Probable chemoreceptor glutamine deamidase CheD n=1 Tax=Jeotgalibacillus campisalis TaxID=220754 RepID=A0A0C2VTI1_9BACL|nr:chemotaxis protein CheD [Jeotgalibacillus campisalis]KIL47741.1 chemotaxis protein, stimulates methylation of MCP protein by cheR [Jeotgalibacillus campisalis]